jgi:hypothetical protein
MTVHYCGNELLDKVMLKLIKSKTSELRRCQFHISCTKILHNYWNYKLFIGIQCNRNLHLQRQRLVRLADHINKKYNVISIKWSSQIKPYSSH